MVLLGICHLGVSGWWYIVNLDQRCGYPSRVSCRSRLASHVHQLPEPTERHPERRSDPGTQPRLRRVFPGLPPRHRRPVNPQPFRQALLREPGSPPRLGKRTTLDDHGLKTSRSSRHQQRNSVLDQHRAAITAPQSAPQNRLTAPLCPPKPARLADCHAPSTRTTPHPRHAADAAGSSRSLLPAQTPAPAGTLPRKSRAVQGRPRLVLGATKPTRGG